VTLSINETQHNNPLPLYCCAECRYADCRYAECRYAECRYAECRYAECRGALQCACNTRLNVLLRRKIL
jgi:hypothetical protein